MKAYAGNAAIKGYTVDLQDVDNLSAKIDWISMLQRMAQDYLQNNRLDLQGKWKQL